MVEDIITLSTDTQIKLIGILNQSLDQKRGINAVLNSMLAEITSNIESKLKASNVSIYTIDRDGKSATMAIETGIPKFNGIAENVSVIAENEVSECPDDKARLGIIGWILSTGMSCLAKSPKALREHPHWKENRLEDEPIPGAAPLQSFLGIPLRSINGDVIGMIKAERVGVELSPFSEADQIILQTYAGIVGKCFHYMDIAGGAARHRLSRTKSQNAVSSWARDILAESVSTEGEMDSFLDTIAKLCAVFLKADSCGLFLVDEDGKTLTQRAGTGSQKIRDAIRAYSLVFPDDLNKRMEMCGKTRSCTPGCPNMKEPGDTAPCRIGVTPWIAKTGRSFYAENYEALHRHCFHKGAFDEINFKSSTKCGVFYGVPLEVGGIVTGVIKVENISNASGPDDRKFSPVDRKRFNVLTQDIALSIKLLEEKYKLRFGLFKKATPTIFEILHGGSSVPVLVNRVVTRTRDLFMARACALYLNEEGTLVQPEWAACGWASNKPNVRFYSLVPEESIVENPVSEGQKVGLTVWIAVKRKDFIAKSNLQLTMHPHHRGTYDKYNFKAEQKEKCESFMGVPLLVQDTLIGVLKVEAKKKVDGEGEQFTYFSEQDELVFHLIANSAAIAIENARLLETQKLYEQITNNPEKLLQFLCEYSHSNAYCVTPLINAGKRLNVDKTEAKALIGYYQALMMPEFDTTSLDALKLHIETRKSFYSGAEGYINLYGIFSKALKVQSINEMEQFCTQNLNLLENISYSPNLVNEFRFTKTLITKISECIRTIRIDNDRYREMENALSFAEETIDMVGHPEQNIIMKWISIWKTNIRQATFKKVKSPYEFGLPLTGTTQHLFFGRKDIIKWIADNLKGHVLLLYGMKRMGKSSILHQIVDGLIANELSEKYSMKICPVFIDIHKHLGAKTVDDFFSGLLNTIKTELHTDPYLPGIGVKQEPYQDLCDFIMTFCADLGREGRTLVLMMDEIQSLDEELGSRELNKNILIKMRSFLMNKPANMSCIMVEVMQFDRLTREYLTMRDMSIPKEVGFLDKEDTLSLIEKPVKGSVLYEKDAMEEIYWLTNGHPYLVQALCNGLIESMNKSKKITPIITIEDVSNTVMNYLQDPVNLVFDPIWVTCCADEKSVLKHLGESCFDKRLSYDSFGLDDLRELTSLKGNGMEDVFNSLERKKIISKFHSETQKWRYKVTLPLFLKWVAYNGYK